jgi:hypothetical protein
MGDRRFMNVALLLASVLVFCSSGFAQNGWIWFDSTPAKQRQQDQQPQKPSARRPATTFPACGTRTQFRQVAF